MLVEGSEGSDGREDFDLGVDGLRPCLFRVTAAEALGEEELRRVGFPLAAALGEDDLRRVGFPLAAAFGRTLGSKLPHRSFPSSILFMVSSKANMLRIC